MIYIILIAKKRGVKRQCFWSGRPELTKKTTSSVQRTTMTSVCEIWCKLDFTLRTVGFMAGSPQTNANYPQSLQNFYSAELDKLPVLSLQISTVVKSVKEYDLGTFIEKKKHSQSRK